MSLIKIIVATYISKQNNGSITWRHLEPNHSDSYREWKDDSTSIQYTFPPSITTTAVFPSHCLPSSTGSLLAEPWYRPVLVSGAFHVSASGSRLPLSFRFSNVLPSFKHMAQYSLDLSLAFKHLVSKLHMLSGWLTICALHFGVTVHYRFN